MVYRTSFNKQELIKYRNKEINKWQWIVLFCAFLFQMFPFCVATNLNGSLMPRDWATWTNNNQTIMSITFTIGSVATSLIGPFIAKLFHKQISTRFIYIFGISIAMIGFFSYGINALIPTAKRSLPVVAAILITSNIIIQIGVMIFTGLGINDLISKWWPDNKRGFALGLAYTGGSIGNIWMQQLLQYLSETFGNNNNLNDDGGGNRWITYLILATMGLIVGVLAAIIATRRPLSPIENLDKSQNNIKYNNTSATFLHTRKYPLYWSLAIGFMIIRMASIHVSFSGIFIANGTAYVNNINANELITNGTTVFGVSCLIGNALGGVINQKLSPAKSTLLSGVLQVLAIFCLLYSVNIPNIVYLYFILTGLSVYVFTSTPAYSMGKLYGVKESTNHTSILGIFLAIGYAIGNLLVGPITGDYSQTSFIFQHQVRTNLLGVSIFIFVCLIVGVIISVVSAFIITKHGIHGIINYSPSKFTYYFGFKYFWSILFNTIFVNYFIKKLNAKTDNKVNEYTKIYEYLKINYKNLDNNKIKFLSSLLMYGVININKFKNLDENIVNWAIANKYISILTLADNKYYVLNINNIKFNISSICFNDTKKLIKYIDKKIHIKDIKISKINVHLNKILSKPIKPTNTNTVQIKILENKIKYNNNLLTNKKYKNPYLKYDNQCYLDRLNEYLYYLKNKNKVNYELMIQKKQNKIKYVEQKFIYDINIEIKGYNSLSNLHNDSKVFVNQYIIAKNIEKINQKLKKQ